MSALEALRAGLPEALRDVKLNLQAVVVGAQGAALAPAQRWGVAVAAAAAARHPALLEAVVADARLEVEPAVIEDALAAAALMAMNNVYYRFRHLVAKPSYGEKPARLRMNRMARPATGHLDFELFSLAVSAVNACEVCIQSHERAVLAGGLGEDQVHDAVRIAATIQSAAVALEVGRLLPAAASGAAVAS